MLGVPGPWGAKFWMLGVGGWGAGFPNFVSPLVGPETHPRLAHLFGGQKNLDIQAGPAIRCKGPSLLCWKESLSPTHALWGPLTPNG